VAQRSLGQVAINAVVFTDSSVMPHFGSKKYHKRHARTSGKDTTFESEAERWTSLGGHPNPANEGHLKTGQ